MMFQFLLRTSQCLLVAVLLVSCAQRKAPAPVVTLENAPPERGAIHGSKYKVKPGETLYSIAWRARKDFRELAKWNAIPSPYRIQPGQVLTLVKNNRFTAVKKTPEKPKTKVSTPTSSKKKQQVVDIKKQQGYRRSKQVVNNSIHRQNVSQKVSKWRWPSEGKVITAFSSSAQGKKGIDIAGRAGAPVLSAAAGKVVYAGSALRGYGNLVIIKHNDDYLSAYAHNKKILVKEKQQVEAGQKIAEMGATDAERVKLHFEIRFRGKSVNPMKYLPKK